MLQITKIGTEEKYYYETPTGEPNTFVRHIIPDDVVDNIISDERERLLEKISHLETRASYCLGVKTSSDYVKLDDIKKIFDIEE